MFVAFTSVGLLLAPLVRGQVVPQTPAQDRAPTAPAAGMPRPTIPMPTFPNLKDTELAFVYLDEYGYPPPDPPPGDDGKCLKRFVTRHISIYPHKSPPRATPVPRVVRTKKVKWTVVNACETEPVPRVAPAPSPTPMPGAIAKTRTCEQATLTFRTWEFLPQKDAGGANPTPTPRPILDLHDLFESCADAEVVWAGTEADKGQKPYVRIHVPFHKARSFECKTNASTSGAGRYYYIVELSMCGTFIENRDPVIDVPW
jgi:hypothetical protein